MAKSGVREGTQTKGTQTRAALIEAARRTLLEEGFARTSARNIATRAGCSQASIFYHFDSVPELLLAVLDTVSARRMATFRSAIDGAHGPVDLLRVARAVYRADIGSGDTRVLVELLAGSHAVPGMPAQVAQRLQPWQELAGAVAHRAIPRPFRSRLDPAIAGHALVALFLGLELLGSLRDGPDTAADVMDSLAALATETDR